jgi:hypothetical protein
MKIQKYALNAWKTLLRIILLLSKLTYSCKDSYQNDKKIMQKYLSL